RDRMGSAASVLSVRQGLGVIQLATIIFFEVCGGPYGIEPLISSGRPLHAIVGLIIMPIVWSIPIALVTAELSSQYPETGGQVMWCHRSFGLKWTYIQGYMSFFGNLLDTAATPVMVLDYMEVVTGERSSLERFAAGFTALVFITYLNIRGVEMVGTASVVFAFLCISPFILFVALGIKYIDTSIWAISDEFDFKPFSFDSKFATFLTCLVWNTSGYDMAGACAGEVENPKKVYPKALLITVTLVSLIYIAPLMIGVCVPGAMDYDLWEDGYFGTGVALALGGPWFAVVMGVVGAMASLGQLNSLLLGSSRELYCMSNLGLTPQILDRVHPKFLTPHYSVLFFSACVAPLILFDFDTLVEVSTFLDSIAFVIFFASYLKLKSETHKTLEMRESGAVFSANDQELLLGRNIDDGFQVPGGMTGGIVICIPPMLVCVLVVLVCSVTTWIACVSVVALMFIVWMAWLGPRLSHKSS
ncbi:hypothetical protein SARC_08464, partial [Sphaeroforma arctica JP610]